MTTYAALGSISSGTMRPEDLIPAFVDALDAIREAIAAPGPTTEPAEVTEARKATVSSLDDLLGGIEQRMQADDYFDTEGALWDLDELTNALNEHAPPYAYFGAHEGDGADYGFWLSWGSLEEDCDPECGPVVKVDAGDEWPDPLPEGTEYVLEVTDHGNGTLYTTDHTEVWSVV